MDDITTAKYSHLKIDFAKRYLHVAGEHSFKSVSGLHIYMHILHLDPAFRRHRAVLCSFCVLNTWCRST